MSRWKKLLLQYSITTALAGAFTLLILWLRDYSVADTPVEQYRILADAFTVPGVILVMVGILVWISTDGFFDSLGYIFSRVGSALIPFYGARQKHQTYYDYKRSKEGKRIKSYAFLFFVGLAFVAVAVVFTVLHGQVYVPAV